MFRFFKNNFLNIRFRNLSSSNQGVVGIVVAVLLIGLFVTVLSIIQLIYVPNWMEEIESEHIDNVFDQFCELKLTIDTQAAINITNTPIVTSINLGTNKIPFFMSMQAAGSLDIIENASYIEIGYIDETNTSNFAFYSLGAIRYTSANAYYIPEEHISFVYENGALITDQKSNDSLNIKPSFKYDKNTGDINGTIYFNIVNISGVGGKISKYGYDIDHIRTELFRNKDFDNKINKTNQVYDKINYTNKIKSLNITTNYPYIWYSFINASLSDEGLIKGVHYDIDIIGGNRVCLKFKWNYYSDCPYIELKPTGIYAQIGPGWIDI